MYSWHLSTNKHLISATTLCISLDGVYIYCKNDTRTFQCQVIRVIIDFSKVTENFVNNNFWILRILWMLRHVPRNSVFRMLLIFFLKVQHYQTLVQGSSAHTFYCPDWFVVTQLFSIPCIRDSLINYVKNILILARAVSTLLYCFTVSAVSFRTW